MHLSTNFAAGAGIDLSSLSIVQGKVCWDLYIDGLVVSSDGNVLDALAAAVKVYYLFLVLVNIKSEDSRFTALWFNYYYVEQHVMKICPTPFLFSSELTYLAGSSPLSAYSGN